MCGARNEEPPCVSTGVFLLYLLRHSLTYGMLSVMHIIATFSFDASSKEEALDEIGAIVAGFFPSVDLEFISATADGLPLELEE